MLRFFLFILILFLTINHFLILAGLVFLIYVAVYDGYEIVLLGVLIDGYYGAFYHVPVFTFLTLGVWIIGHGLRKLLLVYNGRNETFS
jgi:hypothetical protein